MGCAAIHKLTNSLQVHELRACPGNGQELEAGLTASRGAQQQSRCRRCTLIRSSARFLVHLTQLFDGELLDKLLWQLSCGHFEVACAILLAGGGCNIFFTHLHQRPLRVVGLQGWRVRSIEELGPPQGE